MIFTPYSDILQSLPSNTYLSDDASESSTFAVGFASTPAKRRRTSRGVKSVSFDESKNTSHECQHSKVESNETWYSAYEIHGFRSLNTFALKQLERASRDLVGDGLMLSVKDVIDNTYTACQGMLFDDIEVLCPVETAQLRQALRNPVFPMGLASYSSVSIRRDVRSRRCKVVQAVLLVQRTVTPGGNDSQVDDNMVANYIRQSSENISRPSRIFAQLIAENQCDYFY